MSDNREYTKEGNSHYRRENVMLWRSQADELDRLVKSGVAKSKSAVVREALAVFMTYHQDRVERSANTVAS